MILDRWRKHYNEERPHSSLNYLSPSDFLRIGSEAVETVDNIRVAHRSHSTTTTTDKKGTWN